MALPEFFDKKLFSINYIAKVCNLSRATIMRFENDGLLTPAYIDPESGYRYYSSDNVAQVIDILKFQRVDIRFQHQLLKYDEYEKDIAHIRYSFEPSRICRM